MRKAAGMLAALILLAAAPAAWGQAAGSSQPAIPDVGAKTRVRLAGVKPVTACHAMVVTAQHLATRCRRATF